MIIITGATRGIGLAIAQALQHTYPLIVQGTTEQSVKGLQQTLAQATQPIHYIVADFLKDTEVEEMLETIQAMNPSLRAIIHCAGNTEDAKAKNMSYESFQRIQKVHVDSFFRLTTGLVDYLEQDSDILCMTSTAGMFGSKGQLNYSAAKGALLAMTYTLSQEWGAQQIRVNAISPAALTDMTRPVIEYLEQKSKDTNTPFPAFWKIGSPEEVAQFIVQFLAKRPSITGAVIGVNGQQVTLYDQMKPVLQTTEADFWEEYSFHVKQ